MTNLVSVKTLDVLLVEDDPGDALITREAFERSQIPNLLHVVDDGEKALNFLRRVCEYQDAPRPSLILLDINLPRLSGPLVNQSPGPSSTLPPAPTAASAALTAAVSAAPVWSPDGVSVAVDGIPRD